MKEQNKKCSDKNIVTEIKNAFDELNSGLNTAVEISSELEVILGIIRSLKPKANRKGGKKTLFATEYPITAI